MRERSRDVVAGDQSDDDSQWSVDDKVVCLPNDDGVVKMKELEPNNCFIVPNVRNDDTVVSLQLLPFLVLHHC
jgi:hypothetical protein